MQLTIQDIKNDLSTLKGKRVVLSGYIGKLELADKKVQNGGTEKYLKCALGDTTGELSAKLWDMSKSLEIHGEMTERKRKSVAVTVEVIVKEWKNEPDLAIEDIKFDYDKPLIDMIEKSKADPNQLYDKLLNIIYRVKKPHFKSLLEAIFVRNYEYPNDVVKQKLIKIRKDFLQTTAATGHHHNYLYGLLEHTVGVLEEAIAKAERYAHVYELDMDLLITGGALHDIGKIYEYSYAEGIEYAEEGEYVYHPVSGSILIWDLNRELEINMPRTEMNGLIHLLTSHHGEYSEHGPNAMCPEAHILSIADMADSAANKALRAMSNGQLKKMRTRIN